MSDAGCPSPLAARPSSGRVDVVATFDLLTAAAVLDDESSFIRILIVTVTGAVSLEPSEVNRRDVPWCHDADTMTSEHVEQSLAVEGQASDTVDPGVVVVPVVVPSRLRTRMSRSACF